MGFTWECCRSSCILALGATALLRSSQLFLRDGVASRKDDVRRSRRLRREADGAEWDGARVRRQCRTCPMAGPECGCVRAASFTGDRRGKRNFGCSTDTVDA